MNRFTLFLMSKKGYQSLVSFLENFNASLIDFIVYARDKNIIQDYSEEIKALAMKKGIKIFQRTEDFKVNSEYIIAVSWRWLIPISDKNTLITMHDSLLPKYRGFAPLVNQLINKEQYIGVTAIVSNSEYDKGEIITQSKTKISYPIRIQDAISQITVLYEDLIKNVVQQIMDNNSLETVSQNEDEASYSLWRDEEDYRIDWSSSASNIQNFIFSVGFPYNGASTYMMGEKIRIYGAIEVDDVLIMNRDVGKVIFLNDNVPVVVCGKGLLKITEAIFEKNSESIFPLDKFRIRFL